MMEALEGSLQHYSRSMNICEIFLELEEELLPILGGSRVGTSEDIDKVFIHLKTYRAAWVRFVV
jgi:hypothetical protein